MTSLSALTTPATFDRDAFARRGWVLAPAAPAAPAESDADHNRRVGAMIVDAMTRGERRAASSFFGGAASTRAQRDALRAALAAATDPALAADIRRYATHAHANDALSAAVATAAVRLLRR